MLDIVRRFIPRLSDSDQHLTSLNSLDKLSYSVRFSKQTQIAHYCSCKFICSKLKDTFEFHVFLFQCCIKTVFPCINCFMFSYCTLVSKYNWIVSTFCLFQCGTLIKCTYIYTQMTSTSMPGVANTISSALCASAVYCTGIDLLY